MPQNLHRSLPWWQGLLNCSSNREQVWTTHPSTLNYLRCNCGFCSVGYRNTLIMACNFAWTMLDATKIAKVVAHTPRTSSHLHAPETDLNNHHQKAKVRTSADKSTNVVLSDIYWITPRLQKWDVEPKIFTELLATYCRPRKCLWLRHHVVLCRLLNLLNLLNIDCFYLLLKSGWNGIEMDIENGCKKLGRWKLVWTNRRCVGDASVVMVCS